ncbi:MAG: hypothetical protein SVY53_05095 [Chloroflexota bacterium]|nr:hypothetical protein [Chloroflexota bacterium]
MFREALSLCYQGTPTADNTARLAECLRLQNAGDKLFGPYERLMPGSYNIYYRLKVDDHDSGNVLATLKVTCKRNSSTTVLRSKLICPSDFKNENEWYFFGMSHVKIEREDTEVQVEISSFNNGLGVKLDVDYVALFPIGIGGADYKAYEQQTIYDGNGYLDDNESLLLTLSQPKDVMATYWIETSLGQNSSGSWRKKAMLYNSNNKVVGAVGCEEFSNPTSFNIFHDTVHWYTGHSDGAYTPYLYFRLTNFTGNDDISYDVVIKRTCSAIFDG